MLYIAKQEGSTDYTKGREVEATRKTGLMEQHKLIVTDSKHTVTAVGFGCT